MNDAQAGDVRKFWRKNTAVEVEIVVVDVKADDTVMLRVAAKPYERLMPSKTWKRMVSEPDKTLRTWLRTCTEEEAVYKIVLHRKVEGKMEGGQDAMPLRE